MPTEPDLPPSPPAAALRILGFDLQGKLTDAPEKVQALLRGLFPEGAPFIEEGPGDRLGIPLSTIPRARRALDNVGYHSVIQARPAAGGVRLSVHLRPYDRLRYIFVKGNGWLIRQDEIQRRISIHTGHTLPLPGPDRDAAVESERQRLIQYLHSEGYFDANVNIQLLSYGEAPATIDFDIVIRRGDGYPVGPVVATGNKTLPASEIDAAFRHLDYQKLWTGPPAFTVRQLRDDIAKITAKYRDLGYPGARVSSSFDPEHSVERKNKNVAMDIKVAEHKRISVVFEGNHSQSASSLRDALTLDEHGSYDDYEVGASADALQRHYQERGRFFARIQWKRETVSAGEDRLTFVIDEGPELKVRGIEFVGNGQLSGEELAAVVTVRTFPWLGYIGLGEGGYVTPRQVELDAERLVQHYKARGFPDAQAHGEAATSREVLGMVGAAAAGAETVSRDAGAIFVRYTIEEGPRVWVSAVDFEAVADAKGSGGQLPYHPAFLRESMSLRPGEPYTPGLLREDGRRIERLMGDAGYPAATVDFDYPRVGPNKIRVLWKIKTGPRVRVGPIFVRGNFITKAETILEQIPVRSGDYLTTTAFERGQRNLGSLQLFNNAAPIAFPGKEEGQVVVPMVVEVEERHMQYNLLHAGLGISTEQKPLDDSFPVGLYARGGYEHRNLLGHGWNLIAGLNYGLLSAPLVRATANFLDRRFFGTLFRFDISGQYFRQATVRLGDIRSWGGSFGFAREMYPGVDAAVHYNLRNTTYTEQLLRTAGPIELERSITLGTTVGSLLFSLQWLRLDNRLVPSRGFKFEAQTEIAPRALSFGYAEASFVKVGLRSTVVIPLGRWLSLRQGLRYDQGFPLDGQPLLPKVERYFAGGDTTLRGFALDRARVETVYYPHTGDVLEVQYRPIGGNLRILQNLDLQFPIAPPLYGSIFLDSGVVADSLDKLGATQFRHGFGVAPLVVKLPIGDFSIAFAWALDPGPGDRGIGLRFPLLHVNIGLMF